MPFHGGDRVRITVGTPLLFNPRAEKVRKFSPTLQAGALDRAFSCDRPCASQSVASALWRRDASGDFARTRARYVRGKPLPNPKSTVRGRGRRFKASPGDDNDARTVRDVLGEPESWWPNYMTAIGRNSEHERGDDLGCDCSGNELAVHTQGAVCGPNILGVHYRRSRLARANSPCLEARCASLRSRSCPYLMLLQAPDDLTDWRQAAAPNPAICS